jgi:hypothetical protein
VEADVDKNGELSLEEVMQVMQSEQKAVSDRRLFLRIVIALGVALLLLLAAVTGMTYGIVELSKDIKQTNNVLVSKDTGAPLSTGNVHRQQALSDLYLADPVAASSLEKMMLGNPAGGVDVYHIASLSFDPNVSVTINTTSGQSFVVDAEGITNLDGTAFTGRRRLTGCSITDINCLINAVTGPLTDVLNQITDGVNYAYSKTYNSIQKGFTVIQSAATTAVSKTVTAANQLADVVSKCSTWSDALVTNNPCCEPYSPLNTLINDLSKNYTTYTTQLTSFAGTTKITECFTLLKTVNATVYAISGQLSNAAGSGGTSKSGKSIDDLFKGVVLLATYEASKCSTCCKNLQAAPGKISDWINKYVALDSVISDQCIAMIDSL